MLLVVGASDLRVNLDAATVSRVVHLGIFHHYLHMYLSLATGL